MNLCQVCGERATGTIYDALCAECERETCRWLFGREGDCLTVAEVRERVRQAALKRQREALVR